MWSRDDRRHLRHHGACIAFLRVGLPRGRFKSTRPSWGERGMMHASLAGSKALLHFGIFVGFFFFFSNHRFSVADMKNQSFGNSYM